MLRRARLAAALREAERTGSLHVLGALLLPIPFLLVAHQLYFWDVGPFVSSRWAVNDDRSYIEILGYVQLVAAAVLLLVVGGYRRRGAVYVGWAVALTVVLLDDALRLHEQGGGWLVRRGGLSPVAGLAPQDLGELAIWALLGVPVVLVLWAAHRVSPPQARLDSLWLAGLTVLLMFFAVGVDMLLEAVQSVTGNTVVHLLLTFVEAGGEVGAMTALLAYVVHLTRRRSAERAPVPPGSPA